MCARKEEEPCTLCVFERYLERERERERVECCVTFFCVFKWVCERER